jgi:glucose-1-phosphate thymidylyltransferase
LPCSKELYPIGFRAVGEGPALRPKVVCHYLLEKMRLAGITRAYIVLREGKWDIPAYLGDGKLVDMHLAYLMMDLPFGPPYTVDQAYPFVQHAVVAFGFPDILFGPDDAFARLLERRSATNADVVLGIMAAEDGQPGDRVELSQDGWVRSVIPKAADSPLPHVWICAVWSPTFTQFMHQHLVETIHGQRLDQPSAPVRAPEELTVGHVLQAALDNGLRVASVVFADEAFLDIGTPQDLVKAVYARGPER